MGKRFWIAVAVGGAVGASAALGFGPYVESKIEDKAARYGASVVVDSITPSWNGVRLRGVDVRFADIPGVRVHVDDVVVAWGERRPRQVLGGRIDAVGSAAEGEMMEAWAEERRAAGLDIRIHVDAELEAGDVQIRSDAGSLESRLQDRFERACDMIRGTAPDPEDDHA